MLKFKYVCFHTLVDENIRISKALGFHSKLSLLVCGLSMVTSVVATFCTFMFLIFTCTAFPGILHFKASFRRTVNVTVFVSGIFDFFNVVHKQHHTTALNPFLNTRKNGDIEGTCERGLKLAFLCVFIPLLTATLVPWQQQMYQTWLFLRHNLQLQSYY